jgi:TP901 family phage tail tape measure protein
MRVVGLQIKLQGTDAAIIQMAALKRELQSVNKEIAAMGKKPVAGSASPGRQTSTGGSKQANPRSTIADLQAQGKEYSHLVRQAAELKARQNEVNDAIRKQTYEFQAQKFAVGSYKAMNAELGKLRDQYRTLSEIDRQGSIGKGILANVQKLDTELKSLDRGMGQFQRNVGNYAGAVQNVFSGGLAALGLTAGVGQIIELNSLLSDAVANVQKTTGFTQDQARELGSLLAQIDSRTAQTELLAIAEGLGRLGLNLPVDDMAKFVEAIDKVNVALGDTLEGDATQIATDLAKLSALFGLDETFGYAEGIERVGAAMNYLGANTKANENFIFEVTKRLQGVAVTAGIAAPEVLAYGATLDELGQNQEAGSTALQQFIVALGQAPDKFAAVAANAGVTAEQFKEMSNNNPNEALLAVLKGAKNSDKGLAGLNTTMETLGLTGSREIATISALANNIDVLEKNLDLARNQFELSNEDFAKSNSLLEEFNTKNNNLAASLEKAKKALIALVVNSGAQDALQSLVEGVTMVIKVLSQIPALIYENKEAFIALTVAIASFNATAIAAQANVLRLAIIQKVEAVRGAIAAARAQWSLNAALTANPIGIVVGLVALLVAGFILLYKNSEKVRTAIDNMSKSFFEWYDSLGAAKGLIFTIVEPLRFLFNIIKNGPKVAFEKAKIDLQNFVVTFAEGLNQLVIKAKIFAEKAKGALSLGIIDVSAPIKQLEKQLKASEKRVLESAKSTKEKTAKLEADTAKTKLEKKKQQLKVESEEEIKNTDDTNKKLTDKDKAAAEQRAKNRLAAAKNILDLETALITNEFDRRAALLRNKAKDDISGLIGDPGQKQEQAKLIQEQLRRDLEALNGERVKANEKALMLVASFSTKLADAQVAAGKAEIDAVIGNAERMRTAMQTQAEIAFAQRQINLENELTSGKINIDEFEAAQIKQQEDFDAERLEMERAAGQERITLRMAQVQSEMSVMSVALQTQLASLSTFREEQQAALLEQLDAGSIDNEAYFEAIRNLDALVAEQKLQAEAEYLLKKNELGETAANEALAFQLESIEKERAAQEEKNKNIIEYEKQRRDVVESFEAALGESIGQFLFSQEKDLKGFLKSVTLAALDALERVINIAIVEATARSLASAESVATFGVAGFAKAALIGGLIKGAFAAIKSTISNFEEGGTIGDGAVWQGSAVPADGGMIHGGNRHAQGGIKGFVGGSPVEIESGEFLLRNGQYSHVINRNSARRHLPTLRALQRAMPSNVTSSSRAMAAMQINRMESGGTLAVRPLAAPISISRTLAAGATEGLAGTPAQLEAVTASMLQLIAATNARIDRIQVVNDPVETMVLGERNLRVRNAKSQ